MDSKPGLVQTKLVKAKTRRGRRYLESRAPKLVEDTKRALILNGSTSSLTIKGVLTDVHKLKGVDSVKFTRKNEDIKPFETGGEASLEFYANRSNCSLFALGSSTKKRPNNLVLGRMHDFKLYDALELGVDSYKSMKEYDASSLAQIGNKPCILFVGDKFESVPEMKQAKSILLDFLRGKQVEAVNLAGLDRVMTAFAVGDKSILLRQFSIKFKKSGTRTPRVALENMGPSLDLSIRRSRPAPPDLEKEATQQPKLHGTKVKNVSTTALDGKIGRIYMPKQKVDTMALSKPKGLKRERRQVAADRKVARYLEPDSEGDALHSKKLKSS